MKKLEPLKFENDENNEFVKKMEKNYNFLENLNKKLENINY